MAFRLGKPLAHGETSRSGLYAITSAKPKDGNNLVLRITMCIDIATMLTQDKWRTIYECWLVPKDDSSTRGSTAEHSG